MASDMQAASDYRQQYMNIAGFFTAKCMPFATERSFVPIAFQKASLYYTKFAFCINILGST